MLNVKSAYRVQTRVLYTNSTSDMDDTIEDDEEAYDNSPGLLNLLSKIPECNEDSEQSHGNGAFKLDLDTECSDLELEDYEEPILLRQHIKTFTEYSESQGTKKSESASSRTIMMQPEMKLLMQEREKEKNKPSDPHQKYKDSPFNDEQKSLLMKFPWMADKLKQAWSDLEEPTKGIGKLRSGMKQASKTRTSGAPRSTDILLKNRNKKKKQTTFLKDDSKDDKPNDTKIVFSRNIPLLVYNKDNKKCIKLGGDRDDSKNNLEEVYRAVHFNPELKKVTLDLEDLRFPEKDRTLRLAVSYMSANTLHNPFVISDDMCKFSYKKELMIKVVVDEIEKRLRRQQEKRRERKERQAEQDEDIRKQKEEEELRGRDFITANKLLEKSKAVNQEILTNHEKRQERVRRIRLRTKSMAVNERAEVKVRQRRVGVPNVSLHKAL